jgi:BRCT domain type II-containing protein
MSIIISKALLKTKPRYPRNPKKSVTPPVVVSYVLDVDKAGDLKFVSKKCRLHKKDAVVKVAKDYGIPSASKKTVKELCGALKTKIMKAERVSNQIKKNLNNVPLAKLYPEAAKKQAIVSPSAS